jgi:hypothetical protein
MTTQQLYLFGAIYLFTTLLVAVLTHATLRRIVGALAGGVATGVAKLGIVTLGERLGLWHMAITWEPYFLALMLIVSSVCGFIFLITWRIARRFGWHGLAVFLAILAAIGPPRDHWYMRRFPEWGSYAPRIAPVLAISAAYVVLVLVGHGLMRLIAGPAGVSAGWHAARRSSTNPLTRTVLRDSVRSPSAEYALDCGTCVRASV